MVAKSLRNDTTAFTLVDMLVAIAVAGLAGTLMIALTIHFERQRAETTRRTQMHESIFALKRIIRTVLNNAPPYLAGPPRQSSVTGDIHEVTIISTGPPVLGLLEQVAFTLRLTALGPASGAVLTWTDGKGEKRSEILARSVSGMSLGYLPSANASGAALWRPRWDVDDGALSALRIVLRFHSSGQDREIVLPVEAEIPVACLRDARLRGCVSEAAGE